MALEIERKFLIKDRSYVEMATSSHEIRQAYLSDNVDATVRVRVRDDSAFITVKGRNAGAVRHEWEYAAPVEDAVEMATILAGGWSIDKTRYIVDYDGLRWEIDEFHGRHEGLVVAEVELSGEDESIVLPPFVGEEVTGRPEYYNSVLAKKTCKSG